MAIPGHVHPSLLAPLNERVSALEVELAELRAVLNDRLRQISRWTEAVASTPSVDPRVVALERANAERDATEARKSNAPAVVGPNATGVPMPPTLAPGAWVFALPDVGGWEYGQVLSCDYRVVVVNCGRHGVIAVPNVPERVVPAREGLGRG